MATLKKELIEGFIIWLGFIVVGMIYLIFFGSNEFVLYSVGAIYGSIVFFILWKKGRKKRNDGSL